MHASLEPVVEHPVALVPSACPEAGQDVDATALDLGRLGVLVLVDHVLRGALGHERSASGSIQVVTKVARLSRALPSSISSSWMIW